MQLRVLAPEEYETTFWKESIRSDGRRFDQIRSTSITYDVSSAMDSSCMVKLGRTTVLVGCKLFLGSPSADKPDQGELEISSQYSPLSSHRYGIGRSTGASYAITATLVRILHGSKVVRMEDLCIERGKLAWKIYLDIVCVDDDGNALDAAVLAAMAALQKLTLPKTVQVDGDGVTYRANDTATEQPLPLYDLPIALTFAIQSSHDSNSKQQMPVVLTDPTHQETEMAASVITIASTPSGKLCAMDVVGHAPISNELIEMLIEQTQRRIPECKKLLLLL